MNSCFDKMEIIVLFAIFASLLIGVGIGLVLRGK